MGYDYDELFPGRFMKSGQFKGKEPTLTITAVKLEDMEERKGVRTKAIVSFREVKFQLVLNRTNGECIKGMFGRSVDGWVGKRVTFYAVDVQAFGSKKLAIRVRGSPDIKQDLPVVCKIGRDEPITVTMKKTAAKANGKAAPTPVPSVTTDGGPPPDDVPPPEYDEMTGEVF